MPRKRIEEQPIEVDLEENFNPFGGLRDLIPAPTCDMTGQSRLFHLKNVGQGRVYICTLVDTGENARFLQLPTQDLQLRRSMLESVGSITVSIDQLDEPHSINRSRLRCFVGVDDIELVAFNANADEPDEETAPFYNFAEAGLGRGEDYRELAVLADVKGLQKLHFCFDLFLHP